MVHSIPEQKNRMENKWRSRRLRYRRFSEVYEDIKVHEEEILVSRVPEP